MSKPVPGIWTPNTGRAPGTATSELIVSRDVGSDEIAFGQYVEMPEPEASLWGRYGPKLFNKAPAQPTIWAELGFAILANDGSLIAV